MNTLNDKRSIQILEKIKEKFPVERCKKILEKGGKVFSKEEILMVRDFLISVSDIAYKIFQKRTNETLDQKHEQNCKIISLKPEDDEIKKVA